MARSIKKGPFIEARLYKRVVEAQKDTKKTVLKTYSRDSTIIPEMVGLTIAVHNGKTFIPVYITEQYVGHKLGEMSPTRVYRGHAGSDKKMGRK